MRMHGLNSTIYVGLRDIYEQGRERYDEFVGSRPQDMFDESFDNPPC